MEQKARNGQALKVIDGESDAKRAELRKHCHKLRSHYECFCDRVETALRPGMLAVWKPGMKNRRSLAYGEPAIVVDVLDNGLMDTEHGCGSVYFREPLDLVLGFIDEDGDFSTLYYDSRRFEPFVDELKVSA